MGKTIVIGASPNSDRYAYKAVHALLAKGETVIPMGVKKGEVGGLSIINDQPHFENVDTITLYIGPELQKQWYDYILSVKPRRVIFNPGTENKELMDLLQQSGIESVIACTLVMLSVGNY